MDRTYIDNHHVVARYLADQLSANERQAFETQLLTDPGIVRELEVAARLKVGLQALNDAKQLDAVLKSKPWFRDERYLAMAASIVAVVGILLWFGRGVFAPPTLVASISQLSDRTGKPLVMASTHAILRTRGIAYDAEIALPTTQQAIELRVLPEVEAHPPRYRVAIARIGDNDSLTPFGDVAHLASADDGFVTVYMNSQVLKPGRYQLTIGGDVDTDGAITVSVFRIKVMTTPSP